MSIAAISLLMLAAFLLLIIVLGMPIAFATGLIAWLNGAATVDWGPLVAAVSAGKVGPTLLALALVAFLLAMVAGILFSWRKESAAYQARVLIYICE
jgi:hypothetical protein